MNRLGEMLESALLVVSLLAAIAACVLLLAGNQAMATVPFGAGCYMMLWAVFLRVYFGRR